MRPTGPSSFCCEAGPWEVTSGGFSRYSSVIQEHFDLNLFPQRVTISRMSPLLGCVPLEILKHSHLSLNLPDRPLSDL